mmetsp:Transcript_50080/g.119142  ORF Transcript_50080/g.119142 Transcript_50080/m.119142 type:complete len:267 (+) Transcript_50080:108-908(+)|eukprot:CAMPEP_0178442984 /NCGR_PEP_ID=MMETSP0689_2-20121128/38548_1 /TAXON_ID=160604 /ORGANISM="Amphidinium massartii, Strain CS-259" /LENGTH=266 /DNA_ID=CAMNT_0020066751 /DNA_START=44 /DNA_END=844 /DNA_ORIENTATION=+
MAEAPPTQELPSIGEAPFNDLSLVAAIDMPEQTGLKTRCFLVRMGKANKAKDLRDSIADFLKIERASIAFAYEGKTLEDAKTLRDNGIIELGPSSRRRGDRIEIKFILSSLVELPEAREKRLRDEEMRKAEKEREQAARERLERERAERQDAQRQQERQQEAERAEEERRQRERCVVRCSELGTTAGIEIETTVTTSVGHFMEQLRAALNIRQGGLVFTHQNGEQIEANRGASLREVGIGHETALHYFYVDADPAEGAGGAGGAGG